MENITENNTGSPDSVQQTPADYIEFHIGRYFNLIYPPILIVIGTIGNILSFLVCIQRKNRNSSPSIYIATLSVLDTIMLLVGLLQYWLLFNFFTKALTEEHCNGMYFVVNFFGNFSHWTIVAITLDRFVVVIFPLKKASFSTPKKTRMVLIIIGVIAAVKNIHFIWTVDFVYNEKTGAAMCAFGLVSKGSWVVSYQWFEVCVSSIFPFLIIVTANTCIIYKLQARKMDPNIRKSVVAMPRSISTEDNSKVDIKPQESRDNTGVTTMLITVSLTFVCLTSPLFIFRLYFSSIGKSKDAHMTAIYHLGHHICHKLWYSNNGVNFCLYSIVGRKFRADLMTLLYGKGQLGWGNNDSSSSRSSSMMSRYRVNPYPGSVKVKPKLPTGSTTGTSSINGDSQMTSVSQSTDTIFMETKL